jgi:hypothetical protein
VATFKLATFEAIWPLLNWPYCLRGKSNCLLKKRPPLKKRPLFIKVGNFEVGKVATVQEKWLLFKLTTLPQRQKWPPLKKVAAIE